MTIILLSFLRQSGGFHDKESFLEQLVDRWNKGVKVMLPRRLVRFAGVYPFLDTGFCLGRNGCGKQFSSAQSMTTGHLKPKDSELKVKIGDRAPDFSLRSIKGEEVRLSQFFGKKNVVISFVPAAWTPVCSDQWPGYIITRELFEQYNAVLLGITVDNLPTLYAWTTADGGGVV